MKLSHTKFRGSSVILVVVAACSPADAGRHADVGATEETRPPLAPAAPDPSAHHDDAPVPDGGGEHVKPAGIGDVVTTVYDGDTDDLLTAGLGRSGLVGPAPTFADPVKPTRAELRRLAIYMNYRALVDISASGGFGTLYGPNVDVEGHATSSEGKIAGREYVASFDDGTGEVNVTLMVQVPDVFDAAHPCIVSATSSGSRGVYGAIATAGEWGLKHRCAVAYTDKGTGSGIHDLAADTVGLIDGTRTTRAAAGRSSLFTATMTNGELASFLAAHPNRIAYKHTHSQQNPEKDWGKYTLAALDFAFWVLNEQFGTSAVERGTRFEPSRTIVIASSVSNGAGAALAAAEEDARGIVDGVVACEPQVQPEVPAGAKLVEGTTPVDTFGRSFAEYVTYAAIYQPCAILAAGSAPAGAALAPQQAMYAKNRCAKLAAAGLLTAKASAAQAEEAMAKLVAYGWHADGRSLQLSHANLFDSLAMAYVNAYGRFRVNDELCGFGYGATDERGQLVPYSPLAAAASFASSGIPDTGGGSPAVFFTNAAGETRRVDFASSNDGVADRALDGALCLRRLVTGKDPTSGQMLTGEELVRSARVRDGIAAVRRSANLHGKPAIVLQGRADALLPIGNTGRAYVAANGQVEGAVSKLAYYEIQNAQHLDALLAVPALKLDSQYVPLAPYFVQAMDLMYAHLRFGAELPPSQVVRTAPRGGAPGSALAITPANVPAIAAAPAAGDAIRFANATLTVPE